MRDLAASLARRGLRLTVVDGRDGTSAPLVTLGVARTTWLQRRLTKSDHIRLESRSAVRTLRRRRGAEGTIRAGGQPVPSLAPPPTLWPIAPTMRRRPAEPATRTHLGGGNPRLVMAPREDFGADDVPLTFSLDRDLTSIGSAPECEIQLGGLEPLHAQVRRDERDEFVLHNLARPEETRVNGAPSREAVLRTATRIDLGRWTLTFSRQEHADHGRPYGGRVGGEAGRQRPQPPRA